MKQHTSEFKNNLIDIGRQIDSVITYGQTTLREELFKTSLVYEGNILKSVMKELDTESSVDIPKGTIINYKMGVKVDNTYEYLDFGNFVVFSSEKQEDTDKYNIVAYDKILYAMKDYENLNVQYPITIRDYIAAICNNLELEFANESDEFVNYNRQILTEKYLDVDGNSLGYTFRDVLDELAQVTASTICINANDELEIRYIQDIPQSNNGDYTITENQLKDTKVDFGEKYGPINTIVLSRGAESDNVYIQDGESVAQYGVHEIRIKDNQIMNGNDRSEYLPDILEKLDGLEYYINDYSSTGICYLDLCDRYKVQAKGNEYECIMFNDEINIDQGVEELIHTEMPKEAQTDYSKADKTDRKINQTTLIVDKQNQQIQSLITQIGDRSEKQTSITQDIDSIEFKISDLEDLTLDIQGENPIQLDNCLEGELIMLRIIGNNSVFKPLLPSTTLYPSNSLHPYGDSVLKVYTHNRCPDKEDFWRNGYISATDGTEVHDSPYNEAVIVSKYIDMEAQQFYISLENDNYKIFGIAFYNNNKEFISKSYPRTIESLVTVPNGTKYIRFEIVNADFHVQDQGFADTFPPISNMEVLNAKPMITQSNEKLAYVKYNSYEVDLKITEELRQLNASVYDEIVYDANYLYDLEEDDTEIPRNKCILIRRVGVNSQGQLYELAEPTYQVLDIRDLMLVQGTNYIDIGTNYTAVLYAKYVQVNDFTRVFATQYQVSSQILQLANSIQLLVAEKVGNDEIIAKINLAVKDEQGIINITGNQVIIDSDYFHLNADGSITATAGVIGGLKLTHFQTGSYLAKDFKVDNQDYQSGIFIPDGNTYMGAPFIYAGTNTGKLADANFLVKHDGSVKVKNISMNGESGYTIIRFDSGRAAMWFGAGHIYFYIDDEANNFFGGLSKNNMGFQFLLRSGYFFDVRDDLHNISIATFYRHDDSGNVGHINLWERTYYFAGQSSGYEIATKNDICDKNVKKNIKKSNTNALDKINQMAFKQFDWDTEKIDRSGHVDIGIVAQQVKEIDENFVEKTTILGKDNNSTELYSINVLNMLTTAMKAIQELSDKNEKMEKQIEDLEKRLKNLEGGNDGLHKN